MSDSWRTLIVLAMHNTADREAVYVRAIKWWLDHSAFDLLVLDSAGRGVPAEFHMPRVHTVTFDQRFFEPPPGPSPTKWELLSLSTLCRERSSLISQYDLVVKVTGKYRVPGLPSALEDAARSSARYVIQGREGRGGSSLNNSEAFGARGSLFCPLIAAFLEPHLRSHILEKRLYVVVIEKQPETAVHRLPLLPIPEEFRVVRSNGSSLTQF